MDTDLILPDEREMALMREEYAKLGVERLARTASAELGKARASEAPVLPRQIRGINIKTMALCLLYLYFAGVLGYNVQYGTQIFDAHRGVGGLRSVNSALGKLNNLG